MRKRKKYTSVSNRHFSSKVASWDFLRFEYSSSSFLFFQRALLFWNHTATCRGSKPSSNASLSFLSDSSLCSFPKFCSSRLTCSALSFLFLLASEAPFSPPLFFLLRRRFGFLLSPEKQLQTPEVKSEVYEVAESNVRAWILTLLSNYLRVWCISGV